MIDEENFPPDYKLEEKVVLFTAGNNIKLKIKSSVSNVIDIKKYSDVNRLYRITCYVKRFIENLKNLIRKKKLNLSCISAKEYSEAEGIWIKVSQEKLEISENYDQLKNQLKLFKDDKNLIRCKGRINEASLPYETKNPILLNRDDYLTVLIVKNEHKNIKHRGLKQTLTQIRNKYWIPAGRQYVKRIISSCTLCKFYNARPYDYPETPDLPKERVNSNVPFTATGVDYFGPMFARNVFEEDDSELDLHKTFVSLYTCATTRGIVLDLVKDASASTFVESLKRFIARRGCPQLMLSDNGKNFISELCQTFCAQRNINWKFSIAEAPWFGGFWERLISCIKKCIKKTIGKAVLTYDEVQTLLFEVEQVINSRPLTYVYDDMEEPVTPNHLLFGRNLLTSNVNNNEDFIVEDCTKRYKHMQTVLSHFWKRFYHEYLTSLREFNNAKSNKKRNINVPNIDDVVIIYEEKMPRQKWRLGKILELIYGKDKNVRGAKVLVGKTGFMIERPINKLYPIETSIYNKDTAKDDVNTDINVDNNRRSKRDAAMLGELRRRFGND